MVESEIVAKMKEGKTRRSLQEGLHHPADTQPVPVVTWESPMPSQVTLRDHWLPKLRPSESYWRMCSSSS